MTNIATISKIRRNMKAAERYLQQNQELETGSMEAIDFALCSIARSLEALTGMVYRMNIGTVPEPNAKPEEEHHA